MAFCTISVTFVERCLVGFDTVLRVLWVLLKRLVLLSKGQGCVRAADNRRTRQPSSLPPLPPPDPHCALEESEIP